MTIYDDNGYLSFKNILSQKTPFNFITGARGTGKTYGGLEIGVERHADGLGSFILMRRTMGEAELLWRDEQLNPFTQLNIDKGWNIGIVRASKYTGAIVSRETNHDGTMRVVGEPIGIVLALSTVANLRGFNGAQFSYIFYDEFIPETHVRPIKDEHLAFLNAYETINRNRELCGAPPVLCVCASNSNRLDNPLYTGLNLVTKVDSMKQRGQMVSTLHDRGITLINMERSPVSQKKADTALYKMARGTSFGEMALENKYIGESERTNNGTRPLAEYTPLCNVGELGIYKHKSRLEWYVTKHQPRGVESYGMGDTERARFRRAYPWLWLAYLRKQVFFESRICEILLTNVLG